MQSHAMPQDAAWVSLPRRIWQLQSYDLPHIRRVIALAEQYDINEIQLSHNIINDADQVLENSELAQDIDAICKLAHAHGLNVAIWTHELTRVPDDIRKNGLIQLDNSRIWEWLAKKYTQVFAVCPQIDSLVLTFHETQVSIYDNTQVASYLAPPQRVARLIDELADVCKAHGKSLMVRSFCYEPGELQFIKQGFSLAQREFVVMSKCQPHDWQPFYPHNPLIGDVGGRPQVIEFDAGHEFFGQGAIPYIDTDYLKHRLDYAVSRHAQGAVIRIERRGHHALDTPNWADVHVLSRLLKAPDADPNELLSVFLSERYGKAAAPKLMAPLKRTFDIVNKTVFALGFWATDHSRIPSYEYALTHLDWLGTQKWDADPKWARRHIELMNPRADTLRRIAEEKAEALMLCRQSILELEEARGVLNGADFADLMRIFKREEAVVITWGAFSDVFFVLRACESSPSPEYARACERALVRLKECAGRYAQEINAMSGDGGIDNVERICVFMDEARSRLKQCAV